MKTTLYEYLNKYAELNKQLGESIDFQKGYKEACKDIFKLINTKKIIISKPQNIEVENE